ncbi:hypothetical protein HYV81_03785 [Candidatus Woesearchaeota archaeon]|nr:hypothetical protein [Candidatus Woesearchaeota archaeon]
MANKKAQTGTEYPLITILEILLAIVVGYLFIELGKQYVGREYASKQGIANNIGMALEALSGIQGNAYVEFDNLYDYIVTISSNSVEISAGDPIKGIYPLAPLPAGYNFQKSRFEYPPYLALIKQGSILQASDYIPSMNAIYCGIPPLDKFNSIIIRKSNIQGEQAQEVEKITKGIQNVQARLDATSSDFVIMLGMSNNDKAPNLIKAYIPYDSTKSYYVACTLINQLIKKVSADGYYIVPIDSARMPADDIRAALQNQGVYLELGNIKSDSYKSYPYSAEAAAAVIKALEEIKR